MKGKSEFQTNHILGFKWAQISEKAWFEPTIRLFDPEKESIKTHPLKNDSINWKLSDEQFCTGYHDIESYVSCPAQRSVTKMTTYCQCYSCEKAQGFKEGFLFDGELNEITRQYLSQKHYIYLAYFQPGKIKVGTTSESRKFKRLLEQDARIFTYIAEASGLEIKALERAISKKNHHITESFTSSQKLKTISDPIDIGIGEKTLRDSIKDILKRLGDHEIYEKWFYPEENIEIYFQDKLSKIYFPPRNYSLVEEPEHLSGKFLGFRGRYLFLENNGVPFIFDTKNLIGRKIEGESIHNYAVNIPGSQMKLEI